MFAVQINEFYILGDHIQMFKWSKGSIYIYLLGKSVPEVFADPNKEILHMLKTKIASEIDRRRLVR